MYRTLIHNGKTRAKNNTWTAPREHRNWFLSFHRWRYSRKN